MRFLLPLTILLFLGLEMGALAAETEPAKEVPKAIPVEAPVEEAKPKRGLFSKMFRKEPKKEEPKVEAPAPGAMPEVKPDAKPETKPEPKPSSKPEAKPESKPSPKPETAADAQTAMTDKEKEEAAAKERDLKRKEARAREREMEKAEEQRIALAKERKAQEKAAEKAAALAKEKEMAAVREKELADKAAAAAMAKEMGDKAAAAAQAKDMADKAAAAALAKEKEMALAQEKDLAAAKEKEMALAREKAAALAKEKELADKATAAALAKQREMALAQEREMPKEATPAKTEPEMAVKKVETPPVVADPPDAKAVAASQLREAVKDQIRVATRKSAQMVDTVRKRRGEESLNLAARVEAILARPAPEKRRLEAPVADALRALRRPVGAFVFASKIHMGGRGFSFDDTEDGRELVIEELRRLKTEGGREIERLLEIGRLLLRQGRADMAAAMVERALLAARTQLSRRPGDAEAHALLAEALSMAGGDVRKEMLQEIETALRLDRDQPLALFVRLEDQTLRLREYLLREGPRRPDMPARDHQEVLRRLFVQPPSDAALVAHDAAAAEVRNLVARVMKQAGGKAELMLRASAALMAPVLDVEIAQLARKNKARTFEEFELVATGLEATGGKGRMAKLDWGEQLRPVLEAAGDDGPMIAVVSALPALWSAWGVDPATPQEQVWASLPEKHRQMFENGMDRVARMGMKDDSVNAAKACEAVACLEFATVAMGAKVRHDGLALRAITLDPWRLRALDLLAAHCASGFPAASQALMEIRVAVLNGFSSHHMAAAAADKAQDWAAAERHLEACLSLRPGSLETMNDLIAIRLCGAQTPERFQEVAARFEKARAVYAEQRETVPLDVAEAFVANYAIFLCLKEDWKSATEVMAVATGNGQMSLSTVRDLADLLQGRSAPGER